jgi:DNA-binding MarR family transcriptional regulator
MSPDLRDEIQQRKPFGSLEEEAHLNVIRTAAQLSDEFEQLLKPYGISGAQYNVLRILRGAESGELCRNEIRDRMVTRMSDMTRLLDRMENAGLVARTRGSEDRRLVTTRLTPKGRRLLAELDPVVAEAHRARLRHLSREQLRMLAELLSDVRNAP